MAIPFTGMLVAINTFVTDSHLDLVCIYQTVLEGSLTVDRMMKGKGKS
jgi:hypothetical protein